MTTFALKTQQIRAIEGKRVKRILIGIVIAAAGVTAAVFARKDPPRPLLLRPRVTRTATSATTASSHSSGCPVRERHGRNPCRRQRDPGWYHDYPTSDIHLMKIINELTSVEPHIDGSNILSLDDPELMMHPIGPHSAASSSATRPPVPAPA